MNKKRMAFIDLSNFHDWPMGGMLEYERALLENLTNSFDIDIWGVSVNGEAPTPITINGKTYPINIFTNVVTKGKFKIVPNFWKGLLLATKKKKISKQYDYIYAHTASCLVGIAIIEKGAKLVYHQHGLNFKDDKSLTMLVQRPFYVLAQKVANTVFVVSDDDSVKNYERVMRNKYHVKASYHSVKSPIYLERFDEDRVLSKISNTKKINNFLYTGRLTAYKNAKFLLEVFNLYVKRKNPMAKFIIAGSGTEEEILRKKIRDYSLEDNVTILGAVKHDEIYRLLEKTDVFMTASSGEGVSVSVAEAYAAGVPVLCFKVPGLEKQVIDGVTGKITKNKSVEEFYNSLLYVIENYKELAFNCVNESKNYDSYRISKFIEECIIQD
ncbi:glycosyltransferase [Ligilactobacillus agilis]|uniref:glycosyltransferase n=1 Tax=Ligilactobacillus agilis TaxID=1601 RepID=UPI00186849C9|nr:glycosyltransferase [Ligilactobacillus agilis]